MLRSSLLIDLHPLVFFDISVSLNILSHDSSTDLYR